MTMRRKVRDDMTDIDKKKYIICCPLCDNEKCVKGTDKCEAEIWKKEKESEDKESEDKE